MKIFLGYEVKNCRGPLRLRRDVLYPNQKKISVSFHAFLRDFSDRRGGVDVHFVLSAEACDKFMTSLHLKSFVAVQAHFGSLT